MSNTPITVLSCDVVPQEIADHDFISITVDISKPRKLPVIRTFRHLGNYTKGEFLFYFIFFKIEHFNMILCTDDVKRQMDIFASNFIKYLDACALYVAQDINRQFAP